MRWPTSGSLSPDGSLYYVNNPDGIFQLYRVKEGAVHRLTDFVDGMNSYSLSPDGKWLIVAAAKGGNEQDNLYLIDAAAEKVEPLLIDPETVFSAVVWRRDSKAFAYKANAETKKDFHVYVFDMATRKSQRVLAAEGDYAPADFNSGGDKLMTVKTNSASDSRLFEINLTDGKSREVTPPDETWAYDPVGYSSDDKTFYMVSDYHGDLATPRGLDLASGRIAPLAAEFQQHECDGCVLNEDRSVIAVLVNDGGYSSLALRKLPENEPLAAPLTEKGIVAGIDFCGNDMLFSVNSARTPGIIYRWTIGDAPGKFTAVTQADTQGIDTGKFRLPELIYYKSFDGLEIPAFLYLPAERKEGEAIPFIVSYHGGPEAQYRPAFAREFQYYLSRGFGVLAPNVRGSSGYGRKYLTMDDYKKRMDSVKDGVAAARWLVERGYSRPRQIAAYGGSYGGFMVVACVAEAPDLYGAACDVVGIVNFKTFLERTKDYRRALREAEYGPLTDSAFLESISPIKLVDRINTPMLIGHGRNDPRVPITEAEQLYAALKERNRPVDMIVFDDEGHGFRKESNRIKFSEKLADFLEANLKDTAPSRGAGGT